jgi:hypothetical protein
MYLVTAHFPTDQLRYALREKKSQIEPSSSKITFGSMLGMYVPREEVLPTDGEEGGTR